MDSIVSASCREDSYEFLLDINLDEKEIFPPATHIFSVGFPLLEDYVTADRGGVYAVGINVVS